MLRMIFLDIGSHARNPIALSSGSKQMPHSVFLGLPKYEFPGNESTHGARPPRQGRKADGNDFLALVGFL
jgi:hypothetical protein